MTDMPAGHDGETVDEPATPAPDEPMPVPEGPTDEVVAAHGALTGAPAATPSPDAPVPATPDTTAPAAAVADVDDGDQPDGDQPDGEPAVTPRRPIDGRTWARWAISLATVLACCGYVFWILHPELIFLNTTPTGGDMGAHVWGPAYLRDHLLPHGRLTGWTPDWYAGFPAYTFYMVVPSLLIVAINVGFIPYYLSPLVIAAFASLGWFAYRRLPNRRLLRALALTACVLAPVLMVEVPYNIAFKIVAVSGCVLMPAAVWLFGKGLSLRHPGPELLAIASVPFLMDQKLFHIYGGNIGSTMAGEFAFSISLTLAIAALGVLAMGMATGRFRALSAAMLALAALCHVIPAFFAVVGVLVILVLRSSGGVPSTVTGFTRRMRARVAAYFRELGRGARYLAVVGPVAGLLAAWWYVPFYGRRAYLNDMGWEKLGVKAKDAAAALRCPLQTVIDWTEMKRYLFPFAPHTLANNTLSDDPNMLHGKIFFVLAAVGALLSLVMMVRAGLVLTAMTVISAVAFIYMPQDRFWNARVLPFYYLCIYLLAAIGVYLLLRSLVLVFTGRWVDPWTWASGVMVFGAGAVVFVYLGFTLRNLPWGHVVDANGNTRDANGQELTAASGGIDGYRWMGITAKSTGDARGWAAWNFLGLENKPSADDRAAFHEYKAMIDEMARVGRTNGCGRAYWEYDGALEQYGTPMAPMLLPYFTDSCIGSMEGLYFEASSTTPYHFLVQSELSQAPSQPERFDCHLNFAPSERPYQSFNLDEGIKHLQMLGVRYFMAITDATKKAAAEDPRLRKVGHSDAVQPLVGKSRSTGWDMYEVADVSLVEPLANLPEVYTDVTQDIHEWAKPTIEWFNDEGSWNVYRAAFGPSEWPRGKAADAPKTVKAPKPQAKISNVRTSLDTLSFDVDQVGSPVLVKTSYFPNWEVTGADGPYRVTPNFMVVVPRSTHVSMHYGRSAMEYWSWLATGVGLVLLALLVARPGKRREPGETRDFFGDREPERVWDPAERVGSPLPVGMAIGDHSVDASSVDGPVVFDDPPPNDTPPSHVPTHDTPPSDPPPPPSGIGHEPIP